MSTDGTWVNVGGDSVSEALTRALNASPPTPWRQPSTPRLDAGPRTPGLDSEPITAMRAFTMRVQREKEARRVAERSAPRVNDRVETTFSAAPFPSPQQVPPRGRRNAVSNTEETAAAETGGSFCSTRTDGSDIYVVGGVIRYGNIHSATVEDHLITGTTDYNLYVECNVVAKRTTDGDYFLSGFVSTPDADTLSMLTQATGYPAGEDPDISDAIGKIIFEVGRVTFDDDDIPTFYPTGCGTVLLKHCGGDLSYERA